jgi:hypothetical protein
MTVVNSLGIHGGAGIGSKFPNKSIENLSGLFLSRRSLSAFREARPSSFLSLLRCHWSGEKPAPLGQAEELRVVAPLPFSFLPDA